jgi:hypothetical protein
MITEPLPPTPDVIIGRLGMSGRLPPTSLVQVFPCLFELATCTVDTTPTGIFVRRLVLGRQRFVVANLVFQTFNGFF